MMNPHNHISIVLKKLRQEKGWSLDKTAEVTGVSKAMLGQIERAESSPTIATLWKIASGLQTSFSSFIEEMDTDIKDTLYRAGKTKPLHPKDKKFRVLSLFPYDKKLKCDIYVIELLPGCEHLSPPHQQGVIEHVIVINGKMEVLIKGTWKSLNKGAGLRFNANQPHGYRNTTSSIACFHNIVHYIDGKQ